MPTARVFVYASSSISGVIGFFDIDGVLTDTPSRIWKETRHGSGISRSLYFQYFDGCSLAHAIKIANTEMYERPINLNIHFGVNNAPQSFCYIRRGAVRWEEFRLLLQTHGDLD